MHNGYVLYGVIERGNIQFSCRDVYGYREQYECSTAMARAQRHSTPVWCLFLVGSTATTCSRLLRSTA